MAKNESKFWYYIKRNTPNIKWTRIENTSSLGTPDLLGYVNNFFFTVELKVVLSGNKISFSPHQISFHVRHPVNTFILVDDPKHARVCLYEGKQINELIDNGLKTTPITENLEDCKIIFDHLF